MKKKTKVSIILIASLVVGLTTYATTRGADPAGPPASAPASPAPVVEAAAPVPPPRSADPGGTKTGNASDVPAAKPGAPTVSEMADAIGRNKVAINMMWTLIAGFLVMFMQAASLWWRPG